MALDYLALAMLVVIIALVAYGVIAVYGIPYEIAKARNHPHQDAIRAATWASLFTLGALWPFLWIWALMYNPNDKDESSSGHRSNETLSRVTQLDARVAALEKAGR